MGLFDQFGIWMYVYNCCSSEIQDDQLSPITEGYLFFAREIIKYSYTIITPHSATSYKSLLEKRNHIKLPLAVGITINFGWGKCESECHLVNQKRFNLWIVCNQGQSPIVSNCDRSRIVYNCITPSWIKSGEITFYFPSTFGTLLDSVFHLCWRQISENKLQVELKSSMKVRAKYHEFELLSNYWKYLRSAYLENQLNLFPREVLWGLIYRVGLISSLTLWIHIDTNSCLLSLLLFGSCCNN